MNKITQLTPLLVIITCTSWGNSGTTKQEDIYQRYLKEKGHQYHVDLRTLLANIKGNGSVLDVGKADVSTACRAQLDVVDQALAFGEPWALKMMDARGKPESLFFEGDNFWEGSYDTCVEIRKAADTVPVKYCNIEWWSFIYIAVMTDPSYDGIGLCLPQACTEDDFVTYLLNGVSTATITVPPGFPNDRSALMPRCVATQEEQSEAFRNDPSAIGAVSVLAFFVLLGLIGTIYDVVATSKIEKQTRKAEAARENEGFDVKPGTEAQMHHLSNGSTNAIHVDTGIVETSWKPGTFGKIMISFSIGRNVASILSYKQLRGSIPCLHGIRFLTFVWILLGHTWQLGITVAPPAPTMGSKFRLSLVNQRPDHQVINQMNISVETFFILSAMLTTVSFLKKLEKKKADCEMMGLYYFHRFWRLTPVYMFIMMFYAVIFPYLGAGPFYRGQGDSWGCRSHWWRNLIYLNNLIPVDGGCMGWTWYLANDFQFYVFAPALLFPLFLLPPLGITLITLCAVGGLIARGVIHHQIFLEGQQLNIYTDVYVKPWARCSTYFIGMLFGYIMYKLKFKARMHAGLAVLGWIFGLGAISLSIYIVSTQGSWGDGRNFVAWETLQRPLFSVGVCWMIFACSTGNGGFINSILSWDGWLPWARLSYVGYLVHPIIVYWYVAARPHQLYPETWTLIYWFLGHLALTLGSSIVISTLLEVPFSALEKVMFEKVYSRNSAAKQETAGATVSPTYKRHNNEFSPGKNMQNNAESVNV